MDVGQLTLEKNEFIYNLYSNSIAEMKCLIKVTGNDKNNDIISSAFNEYKAFDKNLVLE